jgi:Flp pilus assembly protein TadG
MLSGSTAIRGAREHAGERGQAVAEFAVAATFFFAMIFGVIDFGRALFTYDLVANAARSGTRWAMVRGSACMVAGCPATAASVQAYVRSAFATGIDETKLTVTTTWSKGLGCYDTSFHGPGCIVNVQVRYPFTFIYNFPPVAMSSSSQMVISQ